MSELLIRGGHVIRSPGTPGGDVVEDGAVLVSGRTIAAVGRFAELRAAHPDARVLGGPRDVVMPG